MIAVGAGRFYRLLYLFLFLPLSLGDDSVETEVLSQRAVKPKTTNVPPCQNFGCLLSTNYTKNIYFYLFSIVLLQNVIGSKVGSYKGIHIASTSDRDKRTSVKNNHLRTVSNKLLRCLNVVF